MNVQNEITTTQTGGVFARANEITAHTLAVVNAAIASGSVTADKVPDMIREVHKAFAESFGFISIGNSVDALASGTSIPAPASEPEVVAAEEAVGSEEISGQADVAEAEVQVEERAPLVSIYDNPYDAVTDTKIHCLIDGVGMKMLKRYIRARYNLEWEDYLRIFNLPADYPSVAPKYSDSKRQEAKALGLGSTVPKTPRALRAVEANPATSTPRSTSERRRRKRDPQMSGRVMATQAKVA